MTTRQLALDHCDPTWDDPHPDDDEDDEPRCHYPDLGGQGLNVVRLHTMTTIRPAGEYL